MGNSTYENLFVLVACRYSSSELEKPVAEGAFAMIDMGDDTEIAKPLARDGGDALFKVGGFLGIAGLPPGSSVGYSPSRQDKLAWAVASNTRAIQCV